MKNPLWAVRCTIFAAGLALMCLNPAHAQEGRWAAAGDPTAKALIDWERQWAEDACTHNGIQTTILAEDFHGTAPDGSLYSKQKEVAGPQNPKTTEEACAMYDVKGPFLRRRNGHPVRQRKRRTCGGRWPKAYGQTHLDRHLAQAARHVANCRCSGYAERNELTNARRKYIHS
jgi:hypothetical protein